MTPGVLDHAIAFTLVAVLPIVAMWTYPRLVASVRTDPGARRGIYRQTIALQWSLVAVVLGVWFALGREWAAIGLALPPGLPTIIGFALTAALVATLHLQTVAVRRGGEAARESVRAAIGTFDALIPRTPTEARWFRALAVTAGACEEVLYRGFLIAYLGAYIGTWPAVVASSGLFGLAHSYQGRANALKGAALSLIAGGLYIGCGTLLWPMILHATLDLYSGAIARYALVDYQTR